MNANMYVPGLLRHYLTYIVGCVYPAIELKGCSAASGEGRMENSRNDLPADLEVPLLGSDVVHSTRNGGAAAC